MYPSIRYTGRFFDDPPGQITFAETEIIAGSGAQTNYSSRWGDYSMMAVDPVDGATFWFTHEYLQTTGSAPWRTRIASFKLSEIQVTVDQQLQGGSSVDSIGRWEDVLDFVAYAVPSQFFFTVGLQEVLRGAQKIIAGEKYNKWDLDDTVTNHRVFNITGNFPGLLISLFKPTHSTVSIRNDLLSAPGQDGGTVDFKDPWLIDYPDPDHGYNKRNQGMNATFKSRPSPFTPDYATNYNGDVYQGVFLNQNQTFDPDKPVYSVRVPQEQVIPFNGQDITWYFQHWDGDGVTFKNPNQTETPVVFETVNAEVRAVYKGHLASSNSTATAYNNGRRIVRSNNSKYHLVYEDNGEVYYTYSTDNGSTWQTETLISDGSGYNKYPSIYVDSNNNYHIVWQKSWGSDIYDILYYKSGASSITNLGAAVLSPEPRPLFRIRIQQTVNLPYFVPLSGKTAPGYQFYPTLKISVGAGNGRFPTPMVIV